MNSEPKKTPPISPPKAAVYLLAPFLVVVLLLEGGARVAEFVWPPMPVDYGWGFNDDSRVFERGSGGMMQTRSEKRVSFAPEAFLPDKPDDEFRIAVLGGSNVNYLDQRFNEIEQSLAESPEANGRAITLINGGGNSYGSTRLLRVLDELLQFDLDYVLVYSGHNEFEEQQQRLLVRLDTLDLQRTLYSSAFARRLRDSWARQSMERIERHNQMELPPNFTESDEFRSDVMTRYAANLNAMIEKARAAGVPIAIGTMATNYWEPDLRFGGKEHIEPIREHYEAGRYEQGLALARQALEGAFRRQACHIENEIIQRVAREQGIPLLDFEARILAAEPNGVTGETLLEDECHLNQDGRVLWGTLAIEHFRQVLRENP